MTNEADLWARTSTHAAISSGVLLRPIGPAAAAAASNGNCESVEILPGATAFTAAVAHLRLSYLTGWSLGGSRVEPSRRTTGPTGADTAVGGGGVGLGSGGLSGGAG